MNSPLRNFKAQVFQALAHPTRIAIVEALRDGEVGAGALLTHLQVEAANLSQHLSVLRDAGLVDVRREGTSAFYFASDPGVFEMCSIVCDGVFKQMRGENQILQKATRQLKKESR